MLAQTLLRDAPEQEKIWTAKSAIAWATVDRGTLGVVRAWERDEGQFYSYLELF